MRFFPVLTATLVLAFALAACGRLPGGAPASEEILSEAGSETAGFALYPVTRAFLPDVAQWPPAGTRHDLRWIGASAGARTQIIQPGDTLTLRIWDSNENSLLTGQQEKMVQLQDVRVAANGTVFLPYVGSVTVLGLTPDLAREALQASLEGIVPSAQLQLDMREGRNNAVDLISGVARPGTYPMPDRNYTVLGLISAGGGISAGLNNPQVRLLRNGQIYGTSAARLLNNPHLDTLLKGGDRVFVEEDARYFLSFGATGLEGQHIFARDTVSAMDAISIAGGFQDAKADPKGLLILREYEAGDLSGQRGHGPAQQRVVFSLDLTTADGLFSARRFAIHSGDLVIGTESPVNDAVTVSSIVGNFFGVFSSASRL